MDKDQKSAGSGLKTCKNCGVPLDPDTKFCVNCGTPIEQKEPEKKPEEQEVTKEQAAAPKPEETQPPVAAPSAAPFSDVPFPDEQNKPPQMSTAAPAAAYRSAQTVKQTGVFAGGILGFVVMAALLAGIVVYGLFQGNFFGLGSIHNMYLQFMIFGTIACCAVLTTRAKGPDLSIGAVMAVTGVIIGVLSGSWIGIVIAVSCCIIIGAANGALIVYLRMPSLLVTLIMTAIVRGVVFLISGGKPLMLGIRQLNPKLIDFLVIRMGIFEIVPLIVFAVAFVTVFLMILLSRLGKPLRRREPSDQRKLSFFLAYVISSVIAGMLGAYILAYQSQASMYTGMGYEIFILFIFAAVTSSRFIDNRVVPVIYAVPATLFYVMLYIMLMFRGGSSYVLQMVMAVVTIGLAVVSYISRKDSFRGILQRM